MTKDETKWPYGSGSTHPIPPLFQNLISHKYCTSTISKKKCIHNCRVNSSKCWFEQGPLKAQSAPAHEECRRGNGYAETGTAWITEMWTHLDSAWTRRQIFSPTNVSYTLHVLLSVCVCVCVPAELLPVTSHNRFMLRKVDMMTDSPWIDPLLSPSTGDWGHGLLTIYN